MNSFEPFLRQISRKLANAIPSTRLEELAKLNPDRIYPENLRHALGTPMWLAKMLCEMSVRQGVFSKYIQVVCPDGAVAATVDAHVELPATVSCWQDNEGDFEQVKFNSKDLLKLEFYKFNGVGATD